MSRSKERKKGLVLFDCLADYKGKDLLRELPDCGHLFHVKCVDPWLRLNPTCPIVERPRCQRHSRPRWRRLSRSLEGETDSF
ncbi:putative transcription factor C2H2 family [Helianthus annuus]|nr:putative transcription factor C2H2 family [Helianthus annuus]